MTFNKNFLIKLKQKLANSDSYPMTKQSVEFLLKSKPCDNDNLIILDAIINDVYQKGDQLLVKQFWNENMNDKFAN